MKKILFLILTMFSIITFTSCDKVNNDPDEEVLHKEVGNVFVHVLEDAGVYKCTEEGREAFMRFVQAL